MKIQEVKKFVNSYIEPFIGFNAMLKSDTYGIYGMLSSCWQNTIPVTDRKKYGFISIRFKDIKNIKRVNMDCGFDDSLECYSHTSKGRIVFEIELKNGSIAFLLISTLTSYHNS